MGPPHSVPGVSGRPLAGVLYWREDYAFAIARTRLDACVFGPHSFRRASVLESLCWPRAVPGDAHGGFTPQAIRNGGDNGRLRRRSSVESSIENVLGGAGPDRNRCERFSGLREYGSHDCGHDASSAGRQRRVLHAVVHDRIDRLDRPAVEQALSRADARHRQRVPDHVANLWEVGAGDSLGITSSVKRNANPKHPCTVVFATRNDSDNHSSIVIDPGVPGGSDPHR